MAAGRPRLRGTFEPPGDKSLSHRALIFAALSDESSTLTGLNPGADVRSTGECLRALGVPVSFAGGVWSVRGVGRRGLRPPSRDLDCGNSGTSIRLLAGVVAGARVPAILTGDASLSARPMGRILGPLSELGAKITADSLEGRAVPPLRLAAARLHGGTVVSSVASAQVKSAVLLAAFVAGVPVEFTEPRKSRDHTERMLKALGARIERIPGGARLAARQEVRAPQGRVPGDPSAAAFFLGAAAALPGSDLTVNGVCLNPTRLGFVRALFRLGARVEVTRSERWCGEPVGSVRVRRGALRGIRVGAASVPGMVDEIPILAVLAAGAARGETRISGAGELRVKESDRISGLAEGLARLGARVDERPDGLIIQGGRLRGGSVDARDDHRLAMAFRIASLLADGPVRIRGAGSMRISHPAFDRDLRRLQRKGSGS